MNSARATFSRFSRAIVRPPAQNFADGLTSVQLGIPDVPRALEQWTEYCAALRNHGCELIELEADARFPDSTFVEDTALIVPGHGAMLTRPGAQSRAGEVDAIRQVVHKFFPNAPQIIAPGTLDAGDICETESEVLIGISHRTNESGATQLSEWLATYGVSSRTIDIRNTPGILHLKSGVTAIGEGYLVTIAALAGHPVLSHYKQILAPASEAYAANCVRVNDVVFVAHGFERTHARLREQGFKLELLDMSEFEKMDGGLSCLSLRF